MKRLVVLLLTAVMVTGVCLTPTIAYATATSVGSDEEADGGSSKGVVDNSTEDDVETESSGNKAGVSNDDTDTSNEDESEGENTSGVTTDEPTTKADDVVDVETVPQSFEGLAIDKNLGGIASYLSTVSNNSLNQYVLKKDVIMLGYNYTKNDSEVDGFLNPAITNVDNMYYNLTFVDFDEEVAEDNLPDSNPFTWRVIENVATIDDAIKFVKDNLDSLRMSGSNASGSITIDVTSMPDCVLVFDGKSGDILGYVEETYEESKSLFDSDLVKLSADVKTNISYNDDKSEASLDFTFALSYPECLGGATLYGFDITDSTGESTAVSGFNSSEYIGDALNQSSGSVKGIPIKNANSSILNLHTTQGEYSVNFMVDTLNNEPEQKSYSNAKPNVTFSVEGGSPTKGTPINVTMYSDIDAVLVFNGRSSGSAVKQYTFSVSQNGSYSWTATTPDGVSSSGNYSINCFSDSVLSANYGKYGTGGISSLPKTGGINTATFVMTGVLLILGGIAVLKRDALLALARLVRRVSL